MNRFKSVKNIQEIIYRIYYKLPDNLQLHCKTCGKEIPLLFRGFLYGYNQYCTYKCSLNDPNCNKDDIREDYLKCYSPYLIYKKRD